MPKFFVYALFYLLLLFSLSSCTEAEKKVEQPVEYDQFGNPVVYTADGEKELINDDCE